MNLVNYKLICRFSKIPGKYRGTKLAARVGYKVLNETGSVLDAVEHAVRSMELSSDFNAGYGAVLTRYGVLIYEKATQEQFSGMKKCKWTLASWTVEL